MSDLAERNDRDEVMRMAADIVAAYLAELNEKYGLEPSEPLSDELVDLLVRLKALKRSGGYRSS